MIGQNTKTVTSINTSLLIPSTNNQEVLTRQQEKKQVVTSQRHIDSRSLSLQTVDISRMQPIGTDREAKVVPCPITLDHTLLETVTANNIEETSASSEKVCH